MIKIKAYFIMFYVASVLIIYSNSVVADEYVKSGITITTPTNWKFSNDKNFLGHRELSFITGEFSAVQLYAFPKNETSERKYNKLNLAGYIKMNFIPRLTSSFNKEPYKLKKSVISRASFKGEKIQIEYSIPDLDDIESEVYLLTLDNAKIIITFYTEKTDLKNVSPYIEDVLKSIEYTGVN